jgi:NtrC-family two-component system response regulator AlgB
MSDASDAALHVLVADDDRYIRETLSVCLEDLGCSVRTAASAAEAMAALRGRSVDMVFLDLRLGNDSGLDLVPALLAESPGVAVVIVTAYATIDTAVEAIRRGATDYLPKPFSPAEIRLRVEQTAVRRRLTRRVSELEQELREATPSIDLDTASPRMRAVLEVIARAASSDAPVLLRGESGTGKTMLARVLHEQSSRARGPFVVVNCPTLTEELLASELFGHARGAFTGAVRDRAGRVEAAEGGTLVLDEIGELSAGLQAKLLRFLQDKQFERIGESASRTADVRVVAATNRDVDADVRSGRLREDLYYRLNVVEITVPPLRDRTDDILRLAHRFVDFFSRSSGRPAQMLSPATQAALTAYSWPGNVRELRNAIERAVILWPAPAIEPAALPERIALSGSRSPSVGGDFTLDEIEREHLLQVTARTATLDEAARVLGIEPSTLWRKRKKLSG